MQSLQNDYLDIIDEVIDRLSKLLKASNNNESSSLIRGLNNAKDALDKAKVILSALQTFRSKEVSL